MFIELKTEKTREGCDIVVSHKKNHFGHAVIKRKLRGSNYFLAHRYVYAMLKGDIPDGFCVCHSCDNPPCINPDHLFLGTLADNCSDRHKKGRTSRANRTPGEINGMSKITEKVVLEVRALRGKKTQQEIAKEFNLSQTHVSGIQLGRYWAHVGGI